LKTDATSETMTVETSIIVRTFNEEKHLGNLFDGFDRQTYRDFEVIVVDSGSFDRTRVIANERADRLVCINSHDFTFGYSLNQGIREAKGKFIAVVSAHMIPVTEHWLENLIAPFSDEKIAMVYGRQQGMACSKFSEAEDYRRTFGATRRTEDFSNFAANNANSAIRRKLWDDKPFDELLLGLEDIDWAKHWMDKGFEVVYEPDAPLYHIHEETWRQVRHRFYREAVAYRRMGLKSRRTIPGELLKETARTLGDFFRAFTVQGNPVAERLSLGQRLREIIYFRLNMNYGTLKGLLSDHPLDTEESLDQSYFDRRTNAVVVQKPNHAVLEEIQIPTIKPGDALIRVAHVAICATDLEIFNGSLGYYKNGMADYPIVPGHEFSGNIAALGQNVTGLNEHDPVVVECIQSCGTCEECQSGNFIGCGERTELGVLRRNGAYAGYVVTPAKFVHKLPADMDLRAATLCEPLAVVLKGLRRVNLSPVAGDGKPKRCAVLGSGPLGHMCAMVLAHQGHDVTAFDRNPKRRALLEGTGIKAADDLSELHRFNVIVEITGDPEVLDRALHESPANAILLLLGLPYGERPFSFEAVAAYDKTVTGSVGSTAEDFEEAIKLLPKLNLEPYFQCPMPLEDFQAAWKKSKQGDVLKVILDPNSSQEIE
jgi:2-desacetyl-2-hydroxyethyl bacteriochlorophyllide A dehydrogenase